MLLTRREVEALVKRREVEALVKLSRTRIYILMREDRFPEPIGYE